jgi:hypothetical protein
LSIIFRNFMNKKTAAFLFLLFCFCAAQSQVWPWARVYGSSGLEWCKDVETDMQGNVYSVSRFSGTITVDTFTLISSGSSDVLIIKHDPTGQVIWARNYGAAGQDDPNAISISPTGAMYVTGTFTGTSNFGSNSVTTVGGADIFYAKFDLNGNNIWLKSVGSAGTDVDGGIEYSAVDSCVICTGSFQTSITLGSNNYTSAGSFDGFVFKADSLGSIIWAQRIGGTGLDFTIDADVSPAGDVVTCNWYASSGMVVRAFSQLGVQLWTGNSVSGTLNPNDIEIDASGNIFLAGRYKGAPSYGPVSFPGSVNYSAFVMKLSSSGNAVFGVPLNNSTDAEAYALALTPAGEMIVGGMFKDQLMVDSVYMVNSQTSNRTGFIVKLDNIGELVWYKNVIGVTDTYVDGLHERSGSVYVSGFGKGGISFDALVFTNSNTAEDLFVAKIQDCTPPSFSIVANGPLQFCAGSSVPLSTSYSSPGCNYQWYLNGYILDDDTNQTIAASGVGYYTLIVTDAGGCSGISNAITVVAIPHLPVPVTSTLFGNSLCDLDSVLLSSPPGMNSYQWILNNNPISGATSNNYTANSQGAFAVITTNGFGCIDTSLVTNVSFGPGFTVSAAVSSSPVCPYTSVTLTATGASTYSWSTGSTGSNITISPGATTTYTVAGTANSCTDTATVTVTVYPQSPLPVITYTGWYLISNISTNIQWYWFNSLISGATNDSLVPTQNGPYTVKYTDGNGCLVVSSAMNIYNASVNEQETQIRFTVNPNPFHSFIVLTDVNTNGTVMLINAVGETIKKWEIIKGNNELQVPGLADGIYFLQVRTSEGVATKKIVKQ